MEIYDLKLAEEMTEIYKEMVGLNKIVVLELVNSKMKCELEIMIIYLLLLLKYVL